MGDAFAGFQVLLLWLNRTYTASIYPVRNLNKLEGKVRPSLKLVIMAALSGASVSWSSDASANLEKIDAFIHEGLPFFSSRVDPAKIRRLKGLLRETKALEPNAYEPSLKDIHYTFTFPGLSVWLLCPPEQSRACLISEVTLTRAGYRTKFNLRVGTTAKELINTLGEPSQEDGHEWLYSGESSRVSFVVRNNKIASIRWDMYTG